MMRTIAMLCVLTAAASAQPAPPGITAEPAPSPASPPPAYPQPQAAPPPYGGYEAPPRKTRSDRFFFAMGLGFGGGGDWLYGAYSAEAAATLFVDAIRLRARLFGTIAGGTMESDWSGGFYRYLAGLEARMCTAGVGTCLFADLDAGFERLTLYDSSSDFVRSDTGLVAGPRFGFDFGGAVRARFALELYQHYGRHNSRSSGTSNERFGTVGLAFALGYQL